MNKKGFEMSFKWIFSIIVGIFVLFFAIYAATRFIDIGTTTISTQSTAQLYVLLDPLETSYDYSDNKIIFPVEVKLYNLCSSDGDFGSQIFQLQEKTIGDKWGKLTNQIKSNSKYVFSDSLERGKTFYVSGISFSYPFKVADLIILYSKPYCFEGVEENLRQVFNIFGNTSNVLLENCSTKTNYVQVCSGRSGCAANIVGDENEGYVEKDGKNLYYTGSLIFAAVFSDSSVYECQVARLAKKISNLCEVYKDKVDMTALRVSECSNDVGVKLSALKSVASAVAESNDVSHNFVTQLNDPVAEIFQANEDMSICKVWEGASEGL